MNAFYGGRIRPFVGGVAVAALAVFAPCTGAQTTIPVGGDGTIGVTSLSASNGFAQVPNTGAKWAAAGGDGVAYSHLYSPTLTVPAAGTVTLTFNHRYNFEYDWDGGCVYVSVNGGPFTYVPAGAFSSNGYVKVMSSSSGYPDGPFAQTLEAVFTGQSSNWGTPDYITSVATLGSFSAGDTIAVEFRGAWDWAAAEAAPNWEISGVRVADAASNDMLNVTFTTGAGGFSVASDTGLAGPWGYAGQETCRFELDADADTADRFTSAPGTPINLNNARLEVVVLKGAIAQGDTFSLFDLGDGRTLQGKYSSVSLPQVYWDLSGLQAGGNGRITALSGPYYLYTWNNPASGAYNWESTNWTYSPATPAPATGWPEDQADVVNLSTATSNTDIEVTSASIALGSLNFGSGSVRNIRGPGDTVAGTLVFDNGPLSASLTRGDVGTTNGSSMKFTTYRLNSSLDVDYAGTHVTSMLGLQGKFTGPGALHVANANGDQTWGGFSLDGSDHDYTGGTTITNATLTLNGTIDTGVVMSGTNSNFKINKAGLQSDILGGPISGAGTVMSTGGASGFTFDNENNSWDGPLRAYADFPGAMVFTSIGNVGEGPTALGSPTTVANGTIYFRHQTVEYIGAGDSTDRVFSYSGFGDWSPTIKASGTTTLGSPFRITSDLGGGGMKNLHLGGAGVGEWSGSLGTTVGSGGGKLIKQDSGTWKLSGANTYTVPTSVNAGTLILDGANTGGGAVTVAADARLGGNGSTASAVTVNSNGRLIANVTGWGAGACDRLRVASLSLPASWTLDVTLDTFSETSKTFTILTTTGGITGFTAPMLTGTAGTGTWSVQRSADTLSLELVYVAAVTTPYQAWDNLYAADLSDPNGDHDGDGLSNYEEFAFGLDPTSASSANPFTDLGGLKGGSFKYTRYAASGLTYTVWTSTDLKTWAEETALTQEEAGPPVGGVQTWSVTFDSPPTSDKLFVRVRAAE